MLYLSHCEGGVVKGGGRKNCKNTKFDVKICIITTLFTYPNRMKKFLLSLLFSFFAICSIFSFCLSPVLCANALPSSTNHSRRKTPNATPYIKSTLNSSDFEPKMSIVIDDFGSYDQSGVETLLTCKEKLTCAVMPNVDNTDINIEQIKAGGHEIILHMPMQAHVSLPESWYGPVYIANYDTPEQAEKKLDECMKKFEGVKGLNIHIGSGVSKNRRLMAAIYDYAKKHDLYFLDSRTIETQSTVQACKDTNSTYLGRDVFLEAEKNRSYQGVKQRLIEGANVALEKGRSIVIGHVGAEGGENTAKAILDTVDEIKKMGVKIVPLSEIYEDMKAQGVSSNF